jgi:hypothetical protein
MYKILSASTNPTLKNIFDAGKNGITTITNAKNVTILTLSLLPDDIIHQTAADMYRKKPTVQTFLMS